MSRRHPDDPFAKIRHLDGQTVSMLSHELLEDVDGSPLGVERTEELGILSLPRVPDEAEDDQC